MCKGSGKRKKRRKKKEEKKEEKKKEEVGRRSDLSSVEEAFPRAYQSDFSSRKASTGVKSFAIFLFPLLFLSFSFSFIFNFFLHAPTAKSIYFILLWSRFQQYRIVSMIFRRKNFTISPLVVVSRYKRNKNRQIQIKRSKLVGGRLFLFFFVLFFFLFVL